MSSAKTPKIKLEDIMLFQNENYVVVNKPPFISTLEDRHEKINLLKLAREFEPDAQVAHRLDKETSGALIIARNPEAYRHIALQFQEREVKKIYHAVVDGIQSFNNTLVDLAIVKQDDGKAKIHRVMGKSAQTYFNSLKSYRKHTLVECRPITGRMHQIRVHLAYNKAPITGDEMYGGKPFLLSEIKRGFNLKKGTEEEPFMKRMALHAFAVEFKDISETKISVEAPYPKDMRALVRQLEENS
jgi:RluA family pseudouridine synthase